VRHEGFLATAIWGLQKLKGHFEVRNLRLGKTAAPASGERVVYQQVPYETLRSFQNLERYVPPVVRRNAPYRVAWFIPPPGPSGGGHQNIFRFVSALQAAGYHNSIVMVTPHEGTIPARDAATGVQQARRNVAQYAPVDDITFCWHETGMAVAADIVIATSWDTAYPVATLPTDALKYYFVQDFEPYFFPVGTDFVLAENTYRVGLHGITAGRWLANKLFTEYAMPCTAYDFGADKELYHVSNTETRNAVLFYARPATERRGFPIGILALDLLHQAYPDVTIHLVGADVSAYAIPFPYVHHGDLPLTELNALYNCCAAALVASFTNMSLMPLELLAAGVIPVVTDGDNNTQVSNNAHIRYCARTPRALADGVIAAVAANRSSELALTISQSISATGWGTACQVMLDLLAEDLRRYTPDESTK
jgi:glycosyltransferase involved in cell wall biosynthesis